MNPYAIIESTTAVADRISHHVGIWPKRSILYITSIMLGTFWDSPFTDQFRKTTVADATLTVSVSCNHHYNWAVVECRGVENPLCCARVVQVMWLNSSPSEQKIIHCAHDIFKFIFINEKFCILVWISQFVLRCLVDNRSALVRAMAWRRTATIHYLNQYGPNSWTQICGTRRRWVNWNTATVMSPVCTWYTIN